MDTNIIYYRYEAPQLERLVINETSDSLSSENLEREIIACKKRPTADRGLTKDITTDKLEETVLNTFKSSKALAVDGIQPEFLLRKGKTPLLKFLYLIITENMLKI